MPRKFVTALCAVIVLTSLPALADDGRRDRDEPRWRQGQQYRYVDDDRRGRHNNHKSHGKHGHGVVVWHGHRRWSPPPRHHGHYQAHRPRPVHRHDSHYRRDRDDWAVYAILALQLAELLNSSQQQSHAWAAQQAAAAPLGDSIQWQDSGAYGSVTPLRDGSDGGGRYCREFQHEIVVGNRRQQGYGTACRQPDGAWEIVS